MPKYTSYAVAAVETFQFNVGVRATLVAPSPAKPTPRRRHVNLHKGRNKAVQ